MLDRARGCVVKIFGAGGFRGLEPYQSGVTITAEGHILTVWSHVLNTDFVTVVLDDGRRFDAEVVAADPRHEIALLTVDASDLPHFDLKNATEAPVGTPIFALSNLFGIASGDEPVSVQSGNVAARSSLGRRLGVYETPYQGDVYLLDVVTSNPGSAGGAVIDHAGRFVGMIGKEMQDARDDTWLNFALPADELASAVPALLGVETESDTSKTTNVNQPVTLSAWGLVLVPDVVANTPAYIDSVGENSAARAAGLRPDDLIVLVDGQVVTSCRRLREALEAIDRSATVQLTVQRGSELLEVPLRAP
ncbi:MAG: trypsin-like peptidase domain-containing protein [Planctomycetales bacterium]|nr:trypsin-like peptidase domain-containing protein [Planctomycetales bacterium]